MLIFLTKRPILNSMKSTLNWPPEPEHESNTVWQQSGSNICLDFHGDPVQADLVVYSDGNHNMALSETIKAFHRHQPGLAGIFYATTPPSVLLDILQKGQVTIGNLVLSRQPHVFISPEPVLQKIIDLAATQYQAFMQSLGNVLLVRAGNPKSIKGIGDLLRDDVRLFLSNPKTEAASYQVYTDTLFAVAEQQNIDVQLMEKVISADSPTHVRVIYGERIHHREAPQALYQDEVDVAIIYSHLAQHYQRIFPELFDHVLLVDGEPGHGPEDEAGNQQTCYHLCAMNHPGDYGELFVAFCMSDEVTEIYQRHGLKRPD